MTVRIILFIFLAAITSSVLCQPDVLHTLGDHGDRITDLESKMVALTSAVGSLQTDLQRVLKENTGLKQEIQGLKSGSLCASVCPASSLSFPSSLHSSSPATVSTLSTPRYPNASFPSNTSTRPISASTKMIPGLQTTNFPAASSRNTTAVALSTSSVASLSSSSTNVSATVASAALSSSKPKTSTLNHATNVGSSKHSANITSTNVPFTASSFSSTAPSATARSTSLATTSTKSSTLGSTTPSSMARSTSLATTSTAEATTTAQTIYKDCEDAWIRGKKMSGATQIQPAGMMSPIHVYCHMATTGGWIVIQRRMYGNISFDRGWTDYKRGFGEFDGDFWIGNELIHQLTTGRTHNTLYISFQDWSHRTKYAEYEDFWIDCESEDYRLNVGRYSGNAGDSFNYDQSSQLRHDHMRFSTKDRDNDPHWLNCAEKLHGGWWFNRCYSSNLNGVYLKQPYGHRTLGQQYGDPTLDGTGIEWYPWQHKQYSLKFTEMMIKLGSQSTTRH